MRFHDALNCVYSFGPEISKFQILVQGFVDIAEKAENPKQWRMLVQELRKGLDRFKQAIEGETP